MATMTETPQAIGSVTPTHEYHAEAHILSGHLKRPIEQKIERYAPVELHDRRGGHFIRFDKDVNIEGLISFTKGETRVSGSRSLKNNGWVTLSTSIVEGLNVFEVITADRIVSQISTKHAYENGHVPDVTFLGTQFTNLQVSGFPVTLKLNIGVCGAKPEGGRSYLDDPTFLNGVREQTKKLAHSSGLPKELKQQYDEKLDSIERLISSSGKASQGRHESRVTCSLVQSIGEIPIPGVKSFGHVLVIPDFGSVALGEIEVGEKIYKDSERPGVYFELTVVKMNLGCVGHGAVQAATTTANGRHNP